MLSNFMQTLLQSLINMSLPDKYLSIDSIAMGVVTQYNQCIISRLHSSYSTPRGETFISSPSSFQTNLPRNITHMETLIKHRTQTSLSLPTKPSNANTAASLLMLANYSMDATTSEGSSKVSSSIFFLPKK